MTRLDLDRARGILAIETEPIPALEREYVRQALDELEAARKVVEAAREQHEWPADEGGCIFIEGHCECDIGQALAAYREVAS